MRTGNGRYPTRGQSGRAIDFDTRAESFGGSACPGFSGRWMESGRQVKVTINGSAVEATIVAIDEKAAKATIKVQGETKERTVNLSDIVKQ